MFNKAMLVFKAYIPMEYYPNSNKVVQFTYQLQNTAPQMVQKQFVGDMVYGCGCEGGQDENSDYTCAEYIAY